MNFPKKKLEEIVDFTGGLWSGKKGPLERIGVLRNTNFRSSGLINYDDVAEIDVEKVTAKSRILKRGDILLEKSGGGPDQPVGRVVYFDRDDPYSFSNFTCRLRIKDSDEIHSKYLWLFLYSLYLSGVTARMQKQTTGIRNLMMPEYRELMIPIPPMDEQILIVEKIEDFFIKINEAQTIRKRTTIDSKNLSEAVLDRTFKNIDLKYKKVTIGEVCKTRSGGTPTKSNPDYWRGVIPWVSPKDMKVNFIYDAEDHISEKAINGSAATLVPSGTILVVVRSGVLKHTLPIALTKAAVAYNQDIKAILSNPKTVLPEYLFYILKAKSRKIINDGVKQGATVQSVISNYIERIEFRLPPISEQQKIVTYLKSYFEKLEALEKLQASTSNKFIALKKSALADALRGNLDLVGSIKKEQEKPIKIFSVQQAIAAILRRNFERGEMVIAKVLYLAQEIYGVPLEIPFSPQNFGPYDQQVKKAITAGLARSNRFFKKKMASQFMVYALDDGSSKIFGYSNSRIARDMETALDSLMPIISKAKSSAIELLATTCKAIQDMKSTDITIINKYISAWKPGKFTDQQIGKMVHFIKSKEWDKALLHN
jgi:type I restriction enzyme S subunit